MRETSALYRAFQKELCNDIPNFTVWRVLGTHSHLKAYKLSIVRHHDRCSMFCVENYTTYIFVHKVQRLSPWKMKSIIYVRSSKLLYDWRSVSQSLSMSWYRAPLWDLRSDIASCRNVVWNLRSSFCGVPSLTRGRVCNLQCNHSMVRVAQNL
jgi:hypothetical protein